MASVNISRQQNRTGVILPIFIGLAVITIVPVIHITIVNKILYMPSFAVDRKTCRNTCWDTMFKAGYEQKYGGYKHVYFNTTTETMEIWIMSVLTFIYLYECVKYLVNLHLKKELRLAFALLYVVSIYPNYFTCWVYFNYINDNFYSQFYHQLFFSITEFVSSCVLIYLCKKNHRPHWIPVFTVVGIAVCHALVSASDQFISNVILQQGTRNQWSRDLGLMSSDVLNIVIPVWVYLRYKREHKCSLPG